MTLTFIEIHYQSLVPQNVRTHDDYNHITEITMSIVCIEKPQKSLLSKNKIAAYNEISYERIHETVIENQSLVSKIADVGFLQLYNNNNKVHCLIWETAKNHFDQKTKLVCL